jgi:hypothetical protein
MLGGFLGLGLDIKGALKADLFLVVDGHVQEASEVVELALHVGVEQGRIALAATPEGVAGPSELMRDLHRFFDLCASESEYVEIGARRRAVHISRVREEVRSSPEQLDTGPILFVLQDLDDFIEVGVALLEVVSFGGDIAIVERVKGGAEFFE